MSLRFTPEQLAETMRHLERQRYKQPDFVYINGEPVKMPAKEVCLLAADGQTPLGQQLPYADIKQAQRELAAWQRIDPAKAKRIKELVSELAESHRQRVPKISPEERAKRAPPPPEQLVGALQDRIHDSGQVRVAKSVRKPNDAAIQASAKIAGNGDAREPDVHPPRTGATRGNHSMAAEIRGRGPPYKSKWEAQYAAILEDRKRAGDIGWWGYEAITLKLPGGVRYTPDFMTFGYWPNAPRLHMDCIEMHEVKGRLREPARIKLRAAIDTYAMFQWFLVRRDMVPVRLVVPGDVPRTD